MMYLTCSHILLYFSHIQHQNNESKTKIDSMVTTTKYLKHITTNQKNFFCIGELRSEYIKYETKTRPINKRHEEKTVTSANNNVIKFIPCYLFGERFVCYHQLVGWYFHCHFIYTSYKYIQQQQHQKMMRQQQSSSASSTLYTPTKLHSAPTLFEPFFLFPISI